MTKQTTTPEKKILLPVERRNAIAYRILAYAVAKEANEIDKFKGFVADTSQKTGIHPATLEQFAKTFMADVVSAALQGNYTLDPPTPGDGLTAYLLLQAKTAERRFRGAGLKGKLANLVEPTSVSMRELKKFAVVFLNDLNIRMLADDLNEASELRALTM